MRERTDLACREYVPRVVRSSICIRPAVGFDTAVVLFNGIPESEIRLRYARSTALVCRARRNSVLAVALSGAASPGSIRETTSRIRARGEARVLSFPHTHPLFSFFPLARPAPTPERPSISHLYLLADGKFRCRSGDISSDNHLRVKDLSELIRVNGSDLEYYILADQIRDNEDTAMYASNPKSLYPPSLLFVIFIAFKRVARNFSDIATVNVECQNDKFLYKRIKNVVIILNILSFYFVQRNLFCCDDLIEFINFYDVLCGG